MVRLLVRCAGTKLSSDFVDYIVMAKKLRVILFGAGIVGRQALPNYTERVNVIAFADNDPTKQGTSIFGVNVISPDNIQQMKYDMVVITSTSAGQIKDQLLELGISENKIKIAGEADGVINRHFPWDAVLFLVMLFGSSIALTAFSIKWFFFR